MNLDFKLKGLPTIYYLNLDEREDRRHYFENQCEKFKISNYKRISASSYQLHNFSEWKHKLILNDVYQSKKLKHHIIEMAISLSYYEIILTWLKETSDKYLILMDDDLDFSWIDYWHFDWEYLMNKIPFDWDCIQLSFENDKVFPCFLHPIHSYHDGGATLINREYAEKLIRILTTDNKANFSQNISNYKWGKLSEQPNFSVDYYMSHCGRGYALPLLAINNNVGGSFVHNIIRKDRPDLEFSLKAQDLWWKKFRDDYSLEDFFYFGKTNDFVISPKNISVLMSQ